MTLQFATPTSNLNSFDVDIITIGVGQTLDSLSTFQNVSRKIIYDQDNARISFPNSTVQGYSGIHKILHPLCTGNASTLNVLFTGTDCGTSHFFVNLVGTGVVDPTLPNHRRFDISGSSDDDMTVFEGSLVTRGFGSYTCTITPTGVGSLGSVPAPLLNDLGDVDVPAPNNQEVLKYNSGTGNWEAAPDGFDTTQNYTVTGEWDFNGGHLRSNLGDDINLQADSTVQITSNSADANVTAQNIQLTGAADVFVDATNGNIVATATSGLINLQPGNEMKFTLGGEQVPKIEGTTATEVVTAINTVGDNALTNKKYVDDNDYRLKVKVVDATADAVAELEFNDTSSCAHATYDGSKWQAAPFSVPIITSTTGGYANINANYNPTLRWVPEDITGGVGAWSWPSSVGAPAGSIFSQGAGLASTTVGGKTGLYCNPASVADATQFLVLDLGQDYLATSNTGFTVAMVVQDYDCSFSGGGRLFSIVSSTVADDGNDVDSAVLSACGGPADDLRIYYQVSAGAAYGVVPYNLVPQSNTNVTGSPLVIIFNYVNSSNTLTVQYQRDTDVLAHGSTVQDFDPLVNRRLAFGTRLPAQTNQGRIKVAEVLYWDFSLNPSDATFISQDLLVEYQRRPGVLSLERSVPPTRDDDNTLGHCVGSTWVDKADGREYVCVDAASGNAVWRLRTLLTNTDLNEKVAELDMTDAVTGLTTLEVPANDGRLVLSTLGETQNWDNNSAGGLNFRLGQGLGNIIGDRVTCVTGNAYPFLAGMDYTNLSLVTGAISYEDFVTPLVVTDPAAYTLVDFPGVLQSGSFQVSTNSLGRLTNDDGLTWAFQINATIAVTGAVNQEVEVALFVNGVKASNAYVATVANAGRYVSLAGSWEQDIKGTSNGGVGPANQYCELYLRRNTGSGDIDVASAFLSMNAVKLMDRPP